VDYVELLIIFVGGGVGEVGGGNCTSGAEEIMWMIGGGDVEDMNWVIEGIEGDDVC